MTIRTVETEHDRKMLGRFIEGHKLPFIAELTPGKRRSVEQNKLQRKWMTEISEQLGDRTPEDVRAYCKLTIGVPILREENETFRAKYDAIVRPLPYEQKIAIMSEPLDMPVTRLMTSKQKHVYLDAIFQHFSEKGVVLTIPPDKRYGPAIEDEHETSSTTAPGDDAGSGALSSEPATEEAGEAADGQSAPASETIDLGKRLLMEECIDNMLRDAVSEPAIERPAKVDKMRDIFLKELPDHADFVQRCHETARRIIGKSGEKDRAREYLLSKVPA